MSRFLLLFTALAVPALATPSPQSVTVTDLGTLAGKFGATYPTAINDAGFLAGTTEMPDGTRHAFRRSPAGVMTDLGTLGGLFSVADAINGLGWVAGTSTLADNEEDQHAFLWRPGVGLTDLGTLPNSEGGVYSARDVNDAGVVVGQYYGPEPDYAYKAWVWSVADPVMRELPGLGGPITELFDLNASGYAVGSSQNADDVNRAVLWTPAREVIDLGQVEGQYSYAFALNDSNHVVGAVDNHPWGDQAFLWKDGVMTNLGTLTGPTGNSWASGINSGGEIVGTSPSGIAMHAVRWTSSGQIEDLGTLEPDGSSEGKAINDSGRIVGFASFQDQIRAFVWDLGQGMRNLGALANEGSSTGIDVNNSGTVLGYGENGAGYVRGFVAPGPGTLEDIGTLAGGRSRAFALNDLGQVVGDSFAPSGYFHAFSWTAQGGMVDLGTIGTRHARAIDVNNQGEIIANTGYPEVYEKGPFYWSAASGKIEIPGLGGEERVIATDINNEGQVCGSSVWSDGSARAWIWTRQGGTVALDPIFEGRTLAAALNDHGHVVGERSFPTGEIQGYLWKPSSGFKNLGTLGGAYLSPREFNERGDVAGIATDESGSAHGFLWKGHTQTLGDLGLLGLTHDLNRNRTVVGRAGNPDGDIHAVAGSAAPMSDLGTLGPTHAYSDALSVNDFEEIVGFSSEAETERGKARAFLVRGAAPMIDLGTLGGPSAEAYAINEAGKVAGQAQLANGELHAALWTTR